MNVSMRKYLFEMALLTVLTAGIGGWIFHLTYPALMLADYMWIPAYYYVMGALLMFAVARGSRQKGGAKRMLQLYLLARMGKLFVSVIAIMCFCLAVHMEVPVVIAFIVNYFVYLMYDSCFFSHLGKNQKRKNE